MRWYREGFKLCVLKAVGYVPSHRGRIAAYRACGMAVGEGTAFYHGCEVRNPRGIRIGAYSSIGDHAILDGRGGLTIGDSVNFSTGVWVWTAQHDYNARGFDGVSAPVVVEDYAWVSCRVVVLPGVTIGKGAVIAAGAVVTRSVDPYTVMGGVPAKKIGERSRDLDYRVGPGLPFW